MSPVVTVWPAALLGALLGLDVVSFPQAMWSRPLVAATLGGALAGNLSAGFLVGLLLEMLGMETLPVGASRYPEWGSASVVGGVLLAAAAPQAANAAAFAAALVVALFGALATAWVGSWSMHALRKLNGSWARARGPDIDAGRARAVVGLQLSGLLADLVRGGLLTALALLVLTPLVQRFALSQTIGGEIPVVVSVSAALAVAASAAWKLTRGTVGAHWLLVGGAVASGALMFLR